MVTNNPNPQQRLQFQQRALQQQQQKERLLQQQQKQSLVVPSNATAGAELCKSKLMVDTLKATVSRMHLHRYNEL